MNRDITPDRGVVALAERILSLLDEGSFSSTYKYAVLLGLIDLCLEKTSNDGTPPDTIYPAELAEKVIALYWPHCRPYAKDESGQVLRLKQNSGSQASIIKAIERFRARHAQDPSITLSRAKAELRAGYLELRDDVEWTLIEMPLPKLQRIGGPVRAFLYDISWDDNVRRGVVPLGACERPVNFDNRILLRPGVGAGLVALNALIRPLIHRQWASMVARINRLQEARLEEFLFGAERPSLEAVRQPLREAQDNRCFYCQQSIHGPVEVDHFIPWARYPDNRIQNLVLADRGCNNDKRDHLAATELLDRWRRRNENGSSTLTQLEEIAQTVGWESGAATTMSVARGIYLGLPEGAHLWAGREVFTLMDPEAMRRALGLAGL
jgi:5-methylcytosine-specific restriction endonuclease McrA